MRTFITPFDPVTLREALLRERYRGGQCFYVVPRISDLDEVAAYLREQVPEVRYMQAHGQMSPSQLEDIMAAFYDKQFDVLLSTTIVESGLDIPNANTLIVHRADMFGLAALYQLRAASAARRRAPMRCSPSRPAARSPRRRRSGSRCCIRWTASARASRWRATISTCAARAICSARSSRAISRKSATSCTSRCSKRR